MKKKLLAAILTVIMFLLALGMTLYPLVSNWYYARHQSEIHTQYLEQMEQAEDNTLTRAKELADAYNTALVPGTADDAYSREVLPEDTTYLQIGGDEDFCTLVTCTPFGINTHRLLVRGERVSLEMDAEDDLAKMEIPEAKVAGSTWERHYLLGVGLGLCLAALMVVILLFVTRPWKKGRFEREKKA